MNNNKPIVVAEIGCSHGGLIDRAESLIKLAKLSGADVVKLQKRDVDISTPNHMKDKPHPNKQFSFGETYLEHRQNLELDADQHAHLQKFCKQQDIEYATSVWDMPSLESIAKLNPILIKIPSARNTDFELIDAAYNLFDGEVHVSLGMTNSDERSEIILYVLSKKEDLRKRTVLYHCTSAYPCPFDMLYLREIKKMEDARRGGMWKANGFSNHGYGIAMEPAAYALGARYFERHFIDDRLYKHTDAAPSLEPSGMSKLCRDLKQLGKAWEYKPKEIDDIEKEQRDKLRV